MELRKDMPHVRFFVYFYACLHDCVCMSISENAMIAIDWCVTVCSNHVHDLRRHDPHIYSFTTLIIEHFILDHRVRGTTVTMNVFATGRRQRSIGSMLLDQ